jgi:hypothetical protein
MTIWQISSCISEAKFGWILKILKPQCSHTYILLFYESIESVLNEINRELYTVYDLIEYKFIVLTLKMSSNLLIIVSLLRSFKMCVALQHTAFCLERHNFWHYAI